MGRRRGLDAYKQKNGISEGAATLGMLWNVEVTRDRAYYVTAMTAMELHL
jgi:hypothetical protein